jgi:preprotein translocase subunit SecE
MGKLKDELSTSKQVKPSKAKPGGAPRGVFAQFFINLMRSQLYKPMQGWYARALTAAGLGVIAAAGAYMLHKASEEYTPLWQFALPTGFAAILAWVIFRLVHFPPFAEFLIATEAEMNKVSWTNKDDLIRATTVVLTTVFIMALYLFLVDTLWTFVLRMIGVLNISGGGGFGSTA